MTGKPSESPCAVGTKSEVPLPRFTLRKRKTQTERGGCVPSVNSAFLDGLFADVAEIQDPGTVTQPAAGEPVSEASSCMLEASPSKKSRTSLTRSISRCPKSFKSLGDALFPSCNNLSSPGDTLTNTSDGLTQQITPENSPRTRTKVLSYSKAFGSCVNVPDLSIGSEASPSFPRLPAAVSISSCNTSTLTRSNTDQPLSVTETEAKDCYGWFVEVDDSESKESVDPYHKSTSTNDLAFVANTAPEADDHDAEVEWAKAADTVDDVLGDFF